MKLQVKLFIAFSIVLTVCCSVAIAWRSFKVVFLSFPYEFNPKYIEGNIQILNKSGETTIDGVLKVTKQLDNVMLYAGIGLEVNGNYSLLLNRSVNFCEFLRARNSSTVLRLLYDDLNRYGRLFDSCPIMPATYKVISYRFNEELLPAYLPDATFYIDIIMKLAKADFIYKGRLIGKFDKSKGLNNLKMFSLG